MTSLQIPFAVWNARDNNTLSSGAASTYCPQKPLFLLTQEHCLLTYHSTLSDETWVFIGLPSGVIYKWTFKGSSADTFNDCQQSELVMIGHKTVINAMAISRYRTDCTGLESDSDMSTFTSSSASSLTSTAEEEFNYVEVLVSVDEAGELAVWNCQDGRCLLHNLRAMPLSTATPAANLGAHTIAISPNCEYCVLAGWEGKLVVVRLASLEVVQVVDDDSWIFAAGFLVVPAVETEEKDVSESGAPLTFAELHELERKQLQAQRRIKFVDFITVHASSSPIMARAFDQHSGLFVSSKTAPPKAVLPMALRQQYPNAFRCRLLRSSPSHPGLAAVVTDDDHAWVIDFLTEKYAAFVLDFKVEGIEFLHADVVMLWGVEGVSDLAFYQATLVSDNHSPKLETACVAESESSVGSLSQSRCRSPILSSIVRKLDLVFTDENGELTSHGAVHGMCATRLMGRDRIVQIQNDSGSAMFTEYLIEYDPHSQTRTVRLKRIAAPKMLSLLAAPLEPACTVTCSIAIGPTLIVSGTLHGKVMIESIDSLFNSKPTAFAPILSDDSPAGKCAIEALHFADNMIVSANSLGTVVFWRVNSGDSTLSHCGWTRVHYQHRVTGFHVQKRAATEFQPETMLAYTWSAAGHVALHKWMHEDGEFRTVHVFKASQEDALPSSMFWRQSEPKGALEFLIEFDGGRERMACDLTALKPLALDTPERAAELMSHADGKVVILNPRRWKRSLEQSLLHGGIIVLGGGKDWTWPTDELPVQAILTVDIRALITHIPTSDALKSLAKAILGQLLAWEEKSPDDLSAFSALFNSAGPSEAVAFGLAGANGNLSVWTRRRSREFSSISPTTTATMQMCTSVLLASIEGWSDGTRIAQLQTLYAYGDGTAMRPAAFSFLSKYWQDGQKPAIQSAARRLFSATLTRLSIKQRVAIVRYWQDYLPTTAGPASSSAPHSGSMHRSVVILAVIACQEPSLMGSLLRKAIAESLVSLLLDDSRRNLFRMAAVELIGRGYSRVWRPYVHGGSMVRLLWGWLGQLIAAHQAESHAFGVTVSALISLLTDDVQRVEHLGIWIGEWKQSQPQLGLQVLRRLLDTKPTALAGFEMALVEALFVAGRSAQDHVLHEETLAELISTFGNIARSSDKKRVAACSDNNLIYVFNSATGSSSYGTCLYTLAGHVHPVTTISFAPGPLSLLFSYSAGEACCRWWRFGDAPSGGGGSGGAGHHEHRASFAQSIFGSLLSKDTASTVASTAPVAIASTLSASNVQGQLLRPLKTVVVLPELTAAVECIPTVSVVWLSPLRVRWRVEAKAVELVVGHDLIMTTAMPS